MRDIKLLLVGMILITLSFSCSDQGVLTSENSVDKEVASKNYKTITIEGCQYIVYDTSAGYSGYGYMAHKGNCSNPIHKHNK